jgi:(E)-4-hydroxy-3-methylbut-2-enyl-diphosphate synthase
VKKVVNIGDVKIGGEYPAAVQTMSNLPTTDVKAVVRQAHSCRDEGCRIFRVAVYDAASAEALGAIKKSVKMPIVADIHFDYRLGVAAAKNGADKLRINPGNMPKEGLRILARTAKEYGIPVRVGVNGGSLEKKYATTARGVSGEEISANSGEEISANSGMCLEAGVKNSGNQDMRGISRAEALVNSALDGAGLLEGEGLSDIVVSLKSSAAAETVAAYRLAGRLCGYPLHIGVTEAGSPDYGIIKSAAAAGALLLDGIGDTIRVSLTADPVSETRAAVKILRAVGLDRNYAEVIACPKCGRCVHDTEGFVRTVENFTADVKTPLKIAVMGCAVNGPGEAAESDIGIAFGGSGAAIFKYGRVYKTVPTEEAEREFLREIEALKMR